MLSVAVGLAFESAPARADGDPASDILVSANLSLPYPPPSQPAQQELKRSVDAVYRNGHRIKVAVIASEQDLGAIPSLFGKPADYARFLGQELRYVYIGPLLIVMPQGFGIYDGGRSTTAEQRVLHGLATPAADVDGLTYAATSAVQELETAGALTSKDILAPTVLAEPSRLNRDRVHLRYFSYDDSGRARDTITLYADTRPIATLNTPMHPTSLTRLNHLSWDLPQHLHARTLHFCLTATDPANNHSKRSCAQIR